MGTIETESMRIGFLEYYKVFLLLFLTFIKFFSCIALKNMLINCQTLQILNLESLQLK